MNKNEAPSEAQFQKDNIISNKEEVEPKKEEKEKEKEKDKDKDKDKEENKIDKNKENKNETQSIEEIGEEIIDIEDINESLNNNKNSGNYNSSQTISVSQGHDNTVDSHQLENYNYIEENEKK